MAITVERFFVSGAERRIAVRENGYDVICGRVTGLTNATTTPSKALTDAVLSSDSPPTYNHPDSAMAAQGYVLYDVLVRGETATTARIWERYQPITFSGAPVEKLAIEGRSGEHFEPFERHPLTNKPFLVKLPSDPPETTITIDLTLSTSDPMVHVAPLGYPEDLTVITFYGLFVNVPPQLHTLAKKVNDAAWPPPSIAATAVGLTPRPRGHWRASPLDWRWSQRDGRYVVAFSISSRGDQPGEDWSSYTFAVDPSTGKKLAPSATLMTNLLGLPYAPDVVNNTGGVLKSGNFAVTNFSAILGPLINNTPLGNSNPFGFA